MLGMLSYSLYLWHVLLFNVASRDLGLKPSLSSPLAGAALVVVVTAISWGAYRWIEQPFQRVKPRMAPIRTPVRARLASGVADATT